MSAAVACLMFGEETWWSGSLSWCFALLFAGTVSPERHITRLNFTLMPHRHVIWWLNLWRKGLSQSRVYCIHPDGFMSNFRLAFSAVWLRDPVSWPLACMVSVLWLQVECLVETLTRPEESVLRRRHLKEPGLWEGNGMSLCVEW